MYVYNSQENSLYQKFIENNGQHVVNEVSRNFKIKVYGLGFNKLVGVYGLLNIVGYDMTVSMLHDVLKSQKDVHIVQLRRGLKVSFYSH